MKLLLDENLQVKLKYRFEENGFETFTVKDMNWLGKQNGIIEQKHYETYVYTRSDPYSKATNSPQRGEELYPKRLTTPVSVVEPGRRKYKYIISFQCVQIGGRFVAD